MIAWLSCQPRPPRWGGHPLRKPCLWRAAGLLRTAVRAVRAKPGARHGSRNGGRPSASRTRNHLPVKHRQNHPGLWRLLEFLGQLGWVFFDQLTWSESAIAGISSRASRRRWARRQRAVALPSAVNRVRMTSISIPMKGGLPWMRVGGHWLGNL